MALLGAIGSSQLKACTFAPLSRSQERGWVDRLEDLGFKVKKERATIYLSGNVAWDTDPGSGTRARKGSTIVLYVV